MDFSQRSFQPELMDTEHVDLAQFRQCLGELETINRWTFAYRPTLRWLESIARAHPVSVILDVGSGGGDMLRRILQVRKGPGSETSLIGVDLNPWSKQAAEEWSKDLPIVFVTGDMFQFEPGSTVDIIISSLFAHHLDDAQLVQFLRWMESRATKGWFINDLHRHWLPYYFIKAATGLLSRNRFIKHDAAVSVSRAFTRADWQRLLNAADIPTDQVRIRWHFPFRISVARAR